MSNFVPVFKKIFSYMENQEYKIFEIEVGIDYPFVGLDDTFEIKLKLYEDEIQSIIENGKKELWIDNDRETWEYLEDFAPTAFKRANILAEEYAFKRWGEQMLIKNGAKYEYFLPDEISSLIFDSEECEKINQIVKNLSDVSKERFHSDTRILYEEKDKSEWGKLIVNDPYNDNQPFGGIWSHTLGKNKSEYLIHTSLIIKGCRIKVEYSQEYEIESKLLELRIYPAHDKLHEILEKTLLDNGYIIKEILPIGNPPYSKVFYLEGKRNGSDIEVYIKILSNLSKLY